MARDEERLLHHALVDKDVVVDDLPGAHLVDADGKAYGGDGASRYNRLETGGGGGARLLQLSAHRACGSQLRATDRYDEG